MIFKKKYKNVWWGLKRVVLLQPLFKGTRCCFGGKQKAKKTLKNIPKYDTYDQVKAQMISESSCRRTAMTVLANMDILSVEDLRDACKYLFNTYPEEYYTETNSERCVLCLDYKENYQE